MKEQKECLSGYRKIIYFICGLALLAMLIIFDRDASKITAVIYGYTAMGAVFIGGNEVKKLVEAKYNKKENI